MTLTRMGAWTKAVGRRARQALFSINCFVAAGLALYIGFSIGLPRPYWAMSTVYIVSQPLSGALRSKALYRLLGTALGATAALILVPSFAQAPAVLSTALALWVGLCLFVSLQDRTPRAYVFLLAGYTAAIIGFPTAPAPQAVFDTAVARAEEITLGLLCATVVHSLVAPQGVGPALARRIEAWFDDAQAWTLDMLKGVPGGDDRRRLANDAAEIRILATHLPFDTSNLRSAVRIVHALQDRMTFLLPIIGAVGDRLAELRRRDALPSDAEALVAGAAGWIGDRSRPIEEGRKLAADAAALSERAGPPTDWSAALLANLADRLRQMLEAVVDVRELRAAFQSDARRVPPRLVRQAPGRTPFHRDRYLAFLSALTAVLAIGGCCALWIVTGWPEGSVAALTAAVFCSFFAAQDDPAPAIANFMWFTIASLPVVAVYQFVVLPMIDGFWLLALSLAPVFLALGYFVGDARTSRYAMPVVLGVANGLALAETFSADFAGFANGNVAQVIGLAAALLATRLVRSVGVGWALRRILRSGWRDVARLAAGRPGADPERFRTLMVDRLGLVSERMALLGPERADVDADPLRDMRIGLNIDELKRAEPALQPPAREPVRRLLAALAEHYRALARGEARGERGPLLSSLDQALAAVASSPGAAQPLAARALVGLRRNIFPDSPSPFASAVASPFSGGAPLAGEAP